MLKQQADSVTAGYSAKIEAALVAAAEIADPGVDGIYVGGSLTAGLGNATSDVDLFVLRSELLGNDQRPHQRQVRGHRIDTEYLSVRRLDSAMDRVETVSLARRELKHLWPLLGDLDLLVRLKHGYVVTSTPTLDRLRERLAGLDARLRQVLLARWAAEANNHLEDFFGAVLDGDDATAAWLGRDLMTAAGKALCAAAGDLYVGHKWVYPQLRRSMPASFPLSIFHSYVSGAWTSKPNGLRGLLEFLQTSLGVSQVLGWDGLGVHEWSHWLTGEHGYLRDPAFIPIHMQDSILLNDEYRRQMELSPRATLTWLLAMGLPLDDMLEQAERLQQAGVSAAAGLTRQAMIGLLASLERKRLVGLAPFRLATDPADPPAFDSAQ